MRTTFQLTNLNSVQISTFKRHQETQSHKEGMAKTCRPPCAAAAAGPREAEEAQEGQEGQARSGASSEEQQEWQRQQL